MRTHELVIGMDDNAEISPELDSREGSWKRLCWVCFGTEQDDEDESIVWICPCQCKGTMKWVHEECLQRWIDEKQKRINSLKVSCSQCRTQYVLKFPKFNYLVELLERYDTLLYTTSPFITVSILVGSIYWCCGSYGFISIIQIMGFEEGRRLIEESDPLLLVIGLPVIPISLVMAKLVKWEDFILRLWRNSAFKLPRPLSYLIEEPPSQPRANCDRILYDPGFSEPLGCTRMMCGALLLPTVATMVGQVFFSRVSGSQWRRSLIGGLAFLLFKGVMKIYLRKSQFMRYSRRKIENYEGPSRSVTRDDETGDGDLGGDEPGSSRAAALALANRVQVEESDDESQQPRSRTMFSMTIRL